MGVSALAKLIARKTQKQLQDRVEFLATMHDISAMVLASNHSDYDEIYQTALDNQVALDLAEKEALGYSHDDISAVALAKLNLPEELTDLINYFHQRPAIASLNTDDDKVLAILSLAHQLESDVYGDTRVTETMPESMETLVSLLKLSEDDIDDIREDFEAILNQGF